MGTESTDTGPLPYAWTRYWCPMGGVIHVDAGYLLDPTGSLGKISHKHLVTTTRLPKSRVLVLLGEAGSGKSTELRALAAAQGHAVVDLGAPESGAALRTAIDESIAAAVTAHGTNSCVTLDGLDEALIGIPKAFQVIADCLVRANRTLGRVQISCRTGAWSMSQSERLRRDFGAKAVQEYELVMLREADVRLAAQQGTTDAVAFLRSVSERAAEPLASNPVTLELLLSLSGSGNLPSTRVDLYEKGLLKLCEQPPERRDRSGVPQDQGRRLEASQLLSIATRVAALVHLSASPSVSTAPIGTDDGGAVRLEDISGGIEGTGAGQVDVTEEAIRLAISHTGLFSARGPQRYGFVHKTYGEFLAARFLHLANLRWPQLRPLLYGPDEQPPRVVPQLHETAAWLADLSTDFRDRVMATEPGLLLYSDLRSRSAEFKSRLVRSLLKAIADGEVSSLEDAVRAGPRMAGDFRSLRRFLAGLANPGLGEQLKAVILDSAAHVPIRDAAIEIAEACPSPDGADACATLALDQTAPRSLRLTAAGSVGIMKIDAAAARLLPLARGQAGDDPDNELRGCGLLAVWPKHLGLRDLIACLTPAQDTESYLYRSFVREVSLQGEFATSDLVAALNWSVSRNDTSYYDREEGILASRFAYLGWEQADQPGILGPLARIFVARAKAHGVLMRPTRARGDPDDVNAVMASIRSNDARRRQVIEACLEIVESDEEASLLTWSEPALVQPEDFEWALSKATASGGAMARRYAEVARGLSNYVGTGPWHNPVHLELWLDARGRSEAVRQVMDWPTETALNSSQAERARDELERRTRWQRREIARKEQLPSVGARVDAIRTALDRCDSEGLHNFRDVFSELQYNDQGHRFFDTNIESLPTWPHCPEDLRQRITDVAQRLIETAPVVLTGNNRGDRLTVVLVMAVLRLVWVRRRAALRSLPAARWRELAVAITRGIGEGWGASFKWRQRILRLITRRSPAQVCNEAVRQIRGVTGHAHLPAILASFELTAPLPLRTYLLDQFKASLHEAAVGPALLSYLVATGTPEAEEHAKSLLGSSPPTEAAKPKAIAAAKALTAAATASAWPPVWRSMQGDRTWARELLEAIAPTTGSSRATATLHTKISGRELGQLVELLLDIFDPGEDPRHRDAYTPDGNDNARHWRTRLFNYLVESASEDAIAALRRMRDRWPRRAWLAMWVLEAEKQRRRILWKGVPPRHILALRANAENRVVRSGEELVEVIAESLRAWEQRLRRTDNVRTLWDEVKKGVWKPKDEQTLRNALQAHLEQDLGPRGVVLGKEVEFSRRTSPEGKEGTRTDICATAIGRGPDGNEERFVAVVEIKGIWNKEVATALKDQLIGQYLVEYRAAHGLYVVGWYDGPSWDSDDYRKRARHWEGLPASQLALSQQAAELNASNTDKWVAAHVIDLSLT